VEIAGSAWRIEENGVRATLIAGAERAMLVDTGFGTGDIRQIAEGLTELPITLVISHADGDHTGGNKYFDVAHMSPAEFALYYEKAPAEAKVAPLWGGDVIDLGGRSFEVIDIPGHTPGSIALLDRENRVIITGDTISAGPVFMFGKHRSLLAYIASLERLLTIKDAFDTVYPSHGEFPLGSDAVGSALAGAKLLMAGKLEGRKPQFDLPAKVYEADGAAFFY
jgi:glyoxylase-like metal-dependent hydrolase (beta-lactamase superfamily II)